MIKQTPHTPSKPTMKQANGRVQWRYQPLCWGVDSASATNAPHMTVEALKLSQVISIMVLVATLFMQTSKLVSISSLRIPVALNLDRAE